MSHRIGLFGLVLLGLLALQAGPAGAQQTESAPAPPQPPSTYTVEAGTRIALALVSSVSSKTSSPGDRIYLETAFPVVSGNHIVIPTGSYVTGTVTQVKKPGRVKGRGELYVRFDSITLPNGVTREFRSRLGSVDARSAEKLDPKEGEVRANGNKSGDLKTVATAGMGGASIGGIAGSAAGHTGMGVGIGSAAGVAAGLAGVLLSRGPDAELTKGSTIEMLLDRTLTFAADEVAFGGSGMPGRFSEGPGAPGSRNGSAGSSPMPVMRRPY